MSQNTNNREVVMVLTATQIKNCWHLIKDDPDNPYPTAKNAEDFITACKAQPIHALGGRIVIT